MLKLWDKKGKTKESLDRSCCRLSCFFYASVLSACLLAFLPAFSLYQQCAFCLLRNLLCLSASRPTLLPAFFLAVILFYQAKTVSQTALQSMSCSRLSVCLSVYIVRYPQRFAQNDTILATRSYHQTIQFGKSGPSLFLSHK